VPVSDNRSPRRLKGPDGSSRTLETLYDIAERTENSPAPAEAAGIVLDTLLSRMETEKGMVILAGNGGNAVLSARGTPGTTEARHCDRLEANTPFLLLRERREPFRRWKRIPGANPPRDEIAFLGVPVAGPAARKTLLLADRIYGDSVDPGEDIRLLTACAALLARHLPGNLEGPGGVNDREEAVPLGRILQQQIAAWVGPMEVSRRLRSDVFERLMGEVEKIVIAAALEKTGHVQTETARFLGINRNTLAKKMERHGLKRKER
jgi:Fis family transcriptional regulator